MEISENLRHVAQLIQLAVAPVFLLMAAATTLTVLANRLARIVDRARALKSSQTPTGAAQREEQAGLRSRARLIYRALTLGVGAAIMVSLLMTLAFAGQFLRFDPAAIVAALFMAALFAYTGALICLLREVFLAIDAFQRGLGAAPRE